MKATIVIPNINGKGWLKDSIESIYAQTEQDFELIVVDNGSTDESLDQARGYCDRDNFILIENGHNTGFSYAVNQGNPPGKRGVCGALQQRRLCGARLAGPTYPYRGARRWHFCGSEPDDPPL